MKTLLLLTEDMIKELIPVIGHRARLISNLQEWKAIVQGATDLVWIFFNYQFYLFKINLSLKLKNNFFLNTKFF